MPAAFTQGSIDKTKEAVDAANPQRKNRLTLGFGAIADALKNVTASTKEATDRAKSIIADPKAAAYASNIQEQIRKDTPDADPITNMAINQKNVSEMVRMQEEAIKTGYGDITKNVQDYFNRSGENLQNAIGTISTWAGDVYDAATYNRAVDRKSAVGNLQNLANDERARQEMMARYNALANTPSVVTSEAQSQRDQIMRELSANMAVGGYNPATMRAMAMQGGQIGADMAAKVAAARAEEQRQTELARAGIAESVGAADLSRYEALAGGYGNLIGQDIQGQALAKDLQSLATSGAATQARIGTTQGQFLAGLGTEEINKIIETQRYAPEYGLESDKARQDAIEGWLDYQAKIYGIDKQELIALIAANANQGPGLWEKLGLGLGIAGATGLGYAVGGLEGAKVGGTVGSSIANVIK